MGYFDVFEPTFLQAALQKEQNLRNMVFGKDAWCQSGGTIWHPNSLQIHFKGVLSMKITNHFSSSKNGCAHYFSLPRTWASHHNGQNFRQALLEYHQYSTIKDNLTNQCCHHQQNTGTPKIPNKGQNLLQDKSDRHYSGQYPTPPD
ncbi:hypothetical protein BDN71DRAFT_1428234 [Pleurotus eryngii]|uniref:Uncharacterized protein n=1 Tax=Pleurotus eryngii TaxID=5323 RepID=A0A9P6DJD3_PLEER|nr:hypothetical protein BDN71DRAFT_1428234 [Pleurotus eryngii]